MAWKPRLRRLVPVALFIVCVFPGAHDVRRLEAEPLTVRVDPAHPAIAGPVALECPFRRSAPD